MNFLRKSIGNFTKNSLSITKHLLSKQEFKEKNVVFSPLSLQTVLSIIAAGSEGPTQRQLLSFLQTDSIGDLSTLSSHLSSSVLSDAARAGGPCLSFANGVWVEKTLPLYPSFKDIVATDYNATLDSVDFINNPNEATQKVNLWAEKETNGLIKDILQRGSIDSLTRLVFANAMYFKGAWAKKFEKFEPFRTQDDNFHLLDGNSVKVSFLTCKKRQFIKAFRDFKVLRLPYKQGKDERQFSMYIFLPNTKDGLSALIEKVAFDSESFESMLPNEQVTLRHFRIPRFNFSFEVETSNVLKELGVVLPFSNGGLTKMVNSPIWVSKIFQKSFIEVNEEGTKATALTVATGMKAGRPTDFVADHPFLFFIREDLSGTIIFVGQVLNPCDDV